MAKSVFEIPIVIVYHAGCLDGTAAASAIIHALQQNEHVEYEVQPIPCDYKSAPPVKDWEGKIVYIVDFSWKPSVLLPAIENCVSVTMIDHHQTAIEKWEGVELPSNMKVKFDNTRSGATLAWSVMNEKDPYNAPMLLKHIEDRDLWKFDNRDTKDICEYVMGKIGDLSNVGEFLNLYKVSLRNPDQFFMEARQFGHVMRHCRETLMYKALRRNLGHFKVFGYEGIPVANLAYEFTSDAGGYLSKGVPFAVIYEDNLVDGMRRFSLRSDKDFGVNVRLLAERMGGGGHDHAAGFYLPLKDVKQDDPWHFFE